jgi:hypothetical protein
MAVRLGTSRGELIVGMDATETIRAGGGGDRLLGLAGYDLIAGGAGRDKGPAYEER